jgi:hypothetical protein
MKPMRLIGELVELRSMRSISFLAIAIPSSVTCWPINAKRRLPVGTASAILGQIGPRGCQPFLFRLYQMGTIKIPPLPPSDIAASELKGAFIGCFSSSLFALCSCFFIFRFRALSFLPLSAIAVLLLLLSCSGFMSRERKIAELAGSCRHRPSQT